MTASHLAIARSTAATSRTSPLTRREGGIGSHRIKNIFAIDEKIEDRDTVARFEEVRNQHGADIAAAADDKQMLETIHEKPFILLLFDFVLALSLPQPIARSRMEWISARCPTSTKP